EKPAASADGRVLCRSSRVRGGVDPVFAPDIDRLGETLLPVLRPDDVVLTLGAGSIGKASRTLISPMHLYEESFG
ncbi:MAG: hypothetical protein GY922_14820, partial [Proteobacteria bacterium]|nr:hypothetical protein [Pseudomonadota bacterium]